MRVLREVRVLRLGHRIRRDARVSTHCALVAYAYGASGIAFSGDEDRGLIEKVKSAVRRWGGNFEVAYEADWKSYVSGFRKNGGYVIHSTMYGINLPEAIGGLREKFEEKDLLLIVGSRKVPPEVYELADVNVAVTNLPHSEVASIATILDWLFQGRELSRRFQNAKIRIVPQEKGKRVLESV
ncbi:MAG: tRNA (cytidine(56)-2'-O)-methyltransferase [Candidatus Brockarchaeota archaeon]|nr:tRNA (cytidine(56)-2'-O)-methyltransferase [Candidatus Brockarchaeota archaeon]